MSYPSLAGGVAFLLSDHAAYMAGGVVSVDGVAAAVSTVRPSGGAGAWDTSKVDQLLYDHHANSRSHRLEEDSLEKDGLEEDSDREETRGEHLS